MKSIGSMVAIVVLSILLICSVVFGLWSWNGLNDYKINLQDKVDEQVSIKEEEIAKEKEAEYAEKLKEPYLIYKGPSEYGTLAITYPKTWSNYIETKKGNTLLNGIMNDTYINADDRNNSYALRYKVTSTSFNQELRKFDAFVRSGRVTASPYESPKQPTARAMRIEGEIDPGTKKQGSLVLIELRASTIVIWTEGDKHRADFENILNSLTFIQ